MGCAASREQGPGASVRGGGLARALGQPQLCVRRALLQLFDPSLFLPGPANGAPEAHPGQAYPGHTPAVQGLPGAASSVLAAASLSPLLLHPKPKPCLSHALKVVNWTMAVVDGAISVVAAVQLWRMHQHNPQQKWTRQKVFHCMVLASNLSYCVFFMVNPIASCIPIDCWSHVCGFAALSLPQLLYLATFLLLLSFWIDLCHQATEDVDDEEEGSVTDALSLTRSASADALTLLGGPTTSSGSTNSAGSTASTGAGGGEGPDVPYSAPTVHQPLLAEWRQGYARQWGSGRSTRGKEIVTAPAGAFPSTTAPARGLEGGKAARRLDVNGDKAVHFRRLDVNGSHGHGHGHGQATGAQLPAQGMPEGTLSGLRELVPAGGAEGTPWEPQGTPQAAPGAPPSAGPQQAWSTQWALDMFSGRPSGASRSGPQPLRPGPQPLAPSGASPDSTLHPGSGSSGSSSGSPGKGPGGSSAVQRFSTLSAFPGRAHAGHGEESQTQQLVRGAVVGGGKGPLGSLSMNRIGGSNPQLQVGVGGANILQALTKQGTRLRKLRVKGRQKIILGVVLFITVLTVVFAVLIWYGFGDNPIDPEEMAQIHADFFAIATLLSGGCLAFYGLWLFSKMSRVRAGRRSSDLGKVAWLAVICLFCFSLRAFLVLANRLPAWMGLDFRDKMGRFYPLSFLAYYLIGESVPCAVVLYILSDMSPYRPREAREGRVRLLGAQGAQFQARLPPEAGEPQGGGPLAYQGRSGSPLGHAGPGPAPFGGAPLPQGAKEAAEEAAVAAALLQYQQHLAAGPILPQWVVPPSGTPYTVLPAPPQASIIAAASKAAAAAVAAAAAAAAAGKSGGGGEGGGGGGGVGGGGGMPAASPVAGTRGASVNAAPAQQAGPPPLSSSAYQGRSRSRGSSRSRRSSGPSTTPTQAKPRLVELWPYDSLP